MARKKKPTFTRGKIKKTKKQPVSASIQEWGELKLGDRVCTKIYPNGWGIGPISAFYPDDNHGPAFMFYNEKAGQFKTSLIEWIIEEPTPTQKRILNRKSPRSSKK